MARSYKILEAGDQGKITKEMRRIGIDDALCREAHMKFGFNVAIQMARDLPVFPLWDSASMIEQGWQHMESKEPVDEWVKFIFGKLGVTD